MEHYDKNDTPEMAKIRALRSKAEQYRKSAEVAFNEARRKAELATARVDALTDALSEIAPKVDQYDADAALRQIAQHQKSVDASAGS